LKEQVDSKPEGLECLINNENMKNFLILLFLAATSASLNAQDLIRLKSGEEMKVLIVDVSEKEIQYKKADNANSPIYAVTMEQVASYSKGNAVSNGDEQLKALQAQVKLLQEQIRRDSAYLKNIEARQDTLVVQSKSVNENLVKLEGTITTSQDSSRKSIEKKQDVITKQQDTISKRVDRILNSLDTMHVLLAQKDKEEAPRNWIPKKVGVGIDVSGLIGVGGSRYESFSRAVLFLSYTPTLNFRMEGEFAAAVATYYNYSGNQQYEGGYYFAGAIYGMKQRGPGNFYAGLKFINLPPFLFVTPTFGGEFIFGDRFSIGSEIGILFASHQGVTEVGVAFNRVLFRYYLFENTKSTKKSNYTQQTQQTQQTTSSPPVNTSTKSPAVTYTCASVKTGKFKMNNNIITRTENKQTQVNNKTGEKIEYNVIWLSDCEYELTRVDDAARKIKVKILSVDSTGYYCSYYDTTERQTFKARIDRFQE
jgi:hypothetical protein